MTKLFELSERHLMVNTTMYKCDYRYEVCAGFIHYQKVKTALLLRETLAHTRTESLQEFNPSSNGAYCPISLPLHSHESTLN